MTNYISIYTIILCVFSLNCYAQKNKVKLGNKKIENLQITTNIRPKMVLKTVKSYHVEENINMKFGGYTITYNVSDSSLVNTNDLGPNNTRVVTEHLTREVQLTDSSTETITDTLKSTLPPSNLEVSDSSNKNDIPNSSNKNGNSISIHMIKIYERVAEKGYKSKDIFQQLGNVSYYNKEMDKAARWYDELFALTSDLEPEYYYRYANSLKAIGQNDKAKEILEKFNQLSKNNIR
jgi:tetratricopeptide (TPR) repeat protein